MISHYCIIGKYMRFFLSVMLVFPFMMAMSSCSGDDKDGEQEIDSASELYGIWFASGTIESTNNGVDGSSNWESTIIFNSQGKLLIGDYSEGGGPGKEGRSKGMDFKCRYEIKDDKMIKVYNGIRDEYVLLYKIVGNNLILEYVSGDKPSILHGKDRVVYTNKSKVDIVECPYGFWNAIVYIGNVQRKYELAFFMDNTIYFSEKDRDNNLTILEKYRYEFTGNKIDIYKEDNQSTKQDCILSYKVIGNNITLEYISGEKPLFISLFNSDKATYEIKK